MMFFVISRGDQFSTGRMMVLMKEINVHPEKGNELVLDETLTEKSRVSNSIFLCTKIQKSDLFYRQSQVGQNSSPNILGYFRSALCVALRVIQSYDGPSVHKSIGSRGKREGFSPVVSDCRKGKKFYSSSPTGRSIGLWRPRAEIVTIFELSV